MAFAFAAGDETGQTGFRFDSGSTELFVITLILTNNQEVIANSIQQIKFDIGLPNLKEFKFHDTPHKFRLHFFNSLQNHEFVVRSLFVEKRLLPDRFSGIKSWQFYGFFIASLLDKLPYQEINNTTLIMDEFGPVKATTREIRESLRKLELWSESSDPIKNIIMRRSQSEPVIQVADMCGGAIYRWLATGDDTYYRIIKRKTLLWEFRHPK